MASVFSLNDSSSLHSWGIYFGIQGTGVLNLFYFLFSKHLFSQVNESQFKVVAQQIP